MSSSNLVSSSKDIGAKEYMESKVFPTLLPALEELLRWVQTHQNEQPVHKPFLPSDPVLG